MKILNPAYVEPISAKQTKIRAVIADLLAALPTSQRALSFADVRAEMAARFPAVNVDQGDIHQAAADLGFTVPTAD